MYQLLSYPLGPDTPTYGDNPPVRVRILSDMRKGDIANWLSFSTINHNGTHLDAPYHFNPRGKRITDLTLSELAFTAPLLLDIPKADGELITESDLASYEDSLKQADLLLVRTGWGHAHRRSDPTRFGRCAPGFDRTAGNFLLGTGTLRAIAMDIPSAASPVAGPANEEGLEFHRIVLGTGKEPDAHYILLIEDVRLEPDLTPPNHVIVIPLFLKDADAAPVTILAEIEHG